MASHQHQTIEAVQWHLLHIVHI